MAERGGSRVRPGAATGAQAGAPTAVSTVTTPFDFSAMLTIADMLPVMVCTLDRDPRYRFVRDFVN